ncbi:MAG: glutathione S-transferase [Alphaproteobacteria bacterium]|nr:glutathione S-transferase [Alphaproteobacteria bacterium]
MIKLYDSSLSGNCHKVRMMLGFLGLAHDIVPVDWAKGEMKEAWFTDINPRAQLPTLDDNGVVVWDSQAILVYLARHYDESGLWFPDDPMTMTKVMQFLMLGNEEIAALAWARVTVLMKQPRDRLSELQSKGKAGLAVLESALSTADWVAGTDHPTIGDIACFPYAGMAEQGDVALSAYPHVQAWIGRIKALPNYTAMPGL